MRGVFGWLILWLWVPGFLHAQTDNEIAYPSQVSQFYSTFQNKKAWLPNEKALWLLWQYIDSAAALGLKKEDYQFNFIQNFRLGKASLNTAEDSMLADRRFTDAAIHFFRDVMVGNSSPQTGYNGLNYSPDWSQLTSLLASALSSGQFEYLLQQTEPQSAEYSALKNKIKEYHQYKIQPHDNIEALGRAINTVRWLTGIRQQHDHIIVVNIPSANLLVFDREKVTLESKVIVGQRSKRTPTLCSQVEDVVLYPYWMVPKKIATKELLPVIKKNPGYLDANGYQLLNERGKPINPYKIEWDSLSAGYFPYQLRQSTGCDNSLGIIKLNFYNPYTVYLHDTPWKSLFNFNKRFFSHGCMRVEKAVELAKLVLREKSSIVDSLIDKGCLRDQDPIVIQATEKMPVFVLYNTAWVDSAATVRFFEDVYRKFH
jgi:murein L,D-transpeptidase YcbB/YkuD